MGRQRHLNSHLPVMSSEMSPEAPARPRPKPEGAQVWRTALYVLLGLSSEVTTKQGLSSATEYEAPPLTLLLAITTHSFFSAGRLIVSRISSTEAETLAIFSHLDPPCLGRSMVPNCR